MKQTAVEILLDKIILKKVVIKTTTNEDSTCYYLMPSISEEVVEQAKAMEKEQIIEAAERWKGTNFAEQYYNETYGKA